MTYTPLSHYYDFNFIEGNMRDFIYSVYINKENPSATAFELKFGADDNSYWLLKVDITNQLISIGNKEKEVIKTQEYPFISDREYKLNIVVNSGTLKLFIDNSDTASLVFKTESDLIGDVIDNLEESLLTYSQRNITSLQTLSGDIFCGGYEISKIINLTDNNYKLNSLTDYTINEGVVNIADTYLNTLENDTDYEFRAVTSLTDLDFYIHTKEVGAQVYPLVEKNYRGSDVKFELSEVTIVNKVLIDQNDYPFEQNEEIVTIKNQDLDSLKSGEHLIKLYTNNGRPETKFSLYPATETIPELPAPVSHVFFYIDVAIFAALIIGYVTYTLIKRKGRE